MRGAAVIVLAGAIVALVARAVLVHSLPAERPVHVEAPDAGPPPAFRAVQIERSRVLTLDLRGPDFEDARGRGCPLEAVVEERDAGEQPLLRFRCATIGAP